MLDTPHAPQASGLQSPDALVSIAGLRVEFDTHAGPVVGVRDVSFDIARGECVCVVGESGSGKSVSALSLMRLVEFGGGRIARGELRFRQADGRVIDLVQTDQATMRAIRGGQIGMVFQEPMTALNPVFTIERQLVEVILTHRRIPAAAARARALDLLTQMQISEPERRLKQYPHELSGGMRQRVVIAMAMACEPRLLICDEPTTALDVTIQAEILALIDRLKRETGTAVLFEAGSTSMDGYSAGAYWTRKGASGWYVDGVVQGTWYDRIRANSVLGESLKTNGWGFTASLESGYPVALGAGWAIEPQAQLIYQRISIDDGADRFGQVRYDDTNAVYGRVGARLTKNWSMDDGRTITLWGRANLWHTFGADAKTTFTSLAGTNPVTLNTDLGGSWAQFGLGASGQLTKSTSVFASADYNLGLGEAKGHGIAGRLGIKVVW